MAAIAGLVSLSANVFPEDSCQRMLRALEPYSSSNSEVRSTGSIAFGRNSDAFLPEDRFDRQPFSGGDQGPLFVADVRIDNRAELSPLLCSGDRLAEMSDAEILFQAWNRWGPGLIDHVLGDYALACVSGRNEIILLRGPFSQKGLFYSAQPDHVAFASEPAALHASGLVPKSIRGETAARIAAGSYWNIESIFSGIEPVAHGRVLRLGANGVREIASWSPRYAGPRIRSLADAADALRSELDRAVTAQLRHASGSIAVTLSSGRDSSAVAVSAALAAGITEIFCLTAAPKDSFPAAPTRRHSLDETGLATQTAALYPNIRHVICRPDRIDIAGALERAQGLHHLPLLNPLQLPWWERMESKAAALGASVMLSAGGGNFSISLGGLDFLADVIRRSPASGLTAACRALWARPSYAPALLKHALGPRMPRDLYNLLSRVRGQPRPAVTFPFLRAEYRTPLEDEAGARLADRRPLPSYRDFRREMLMNRDHPGKLNIAMWGFDDRDPTLDRRLVELVLSFEPQWLFPAGSERPAFDRAFGSRLPADVLRARKRGLQSADWQEYFTRDVLRAAFAKYSESSLVAEIFDLEQVRSLIESGQAHKQRALVQALSVASFLWVHRAG